MLDQYMYIRKTSDAILIMLERTMHLPTMFVASAV